MSLLPFVIAIAWIGELVGLSVAAVSDLRRRIVPDAVALLLLFNGILLRLADSGNWRSVAASLLVAAAILTMLGQLARRALIGGGDAKLVAAISLMAPAGQVPLLLLGVMLGGGFVACLYVVARRLARHDSVLAGPSRRNQLARLLWRERRRTACGVPMPFAPAVLLGGCGFWIETLLA